MLSLLIVTCLPQKASLSQGWTHIPGGGQSLPRVVYYHPVLKRLIHAPLPELSQLHLGNPLAVLGPKEITANAAQPLGEAPHMVASGGNSSDANVTFALPTVSGRFGVRVMGGADGTGGVVAYVDYVHGQRTHKVGFEPPCAECNSPVDELRLLPDEDEITIRVFSDRTVIEAFWEDGRVAMTTGGAADDGKFGPGPRGSMEIVSGVDVKLVGASVSAMGSIWLPSPSDLRPLKSDEQLQVSVPQVEKMKNLPRNYAFTDYHEMALTLDSFLFGDPRAAELGLYCVGNGSSLMHNGSTWAMPSYAGADRAPCDFQGPCPGGTSSTMQWKPGEGIPLLGSLYAATLNGIDKTKPREDLNGGSLLDSAWLYVGFKGLVGDGVGRGDPPTVGSNWYGVFPSIVWIQLASALPAESDARERMLTVMKQSAELWPQTVAGFMSAPCAFNSTGYDFATSTPVSNHKWFEQDVASGLAWLSVTTASALYGNLSDPRAAELVKAADTALTWLETWTVNPLYEVLGSFGPVAAARMNSELGRRYNTTRHLAWALGNGLDIESRYGWGVMADRWGEEDIGGIAGSNTDGDGYS